MALRRPLVVALSAVLLIAHGAGCGGGSKASTDPGGGGTGGGTGGGSGGGTPGETDPTLTPTPVGGGRDYHVGPGQAYANIGDVPWKGLAAGDTVYIHYRSTPYYEGFLVSSVGTASAWIRVIGVPDASGSLPIIDGTNATTSANSDWRKAWAPNVVEWDGVVQVGPGDTTGLPPQYVYITQLEVRGCKPSNKFTGWDGKQYAYESFCAGVYTRGVKHFVLRDCVIHDNSLGFYNWMGDGTGGGNTWWDATQADTYIQGNYFYDNGNSGSYTEHQTYTESNGVVIEHNRYGPPKTGSLGSQLKDRSAGTVIRYNWIEQSPAGYNLDLVEPENGWPVLGRGASPGNGTANPPNPNYAQDFVYGNVFLNKIGGDVNHVHWNEDHNVGVGRAVQAASGSYPGGRLYYYGNTWVGTYNSADWNGKLQFMNTTWGAYECPSGTLAGRVVANDNIFAVVPRTSGAAVPMEFDYCGKVNVDFGVNWVSPGASLKAASVTGASNLVQPSSNDPGFANLGSNDLRLVSGGSAAGAGSALPSAVSSYLPIRQYAWPHTSPPSTVARSQYGQGSDLGAFQR